MKKTIYVVASLALATAANGATGFFGSYVNVTTNGSAAWYDLSAPGGGRASDPTDFHNLGLGTFDSGAGDTLTVSGAQGLTFKSGGGDVGGTLFNYSVKTAGGSHSFTEETVGFGANSTFNDAAGTSYGGGGDQRWDNTGEWAPVDLLSGLSNGDYEVQVFFRGTGNEVDFFHSNGGGNYTATFTVVPEPSTTALLGLGGLALILRRRK
jgi:hypothetical protein